ncbi:MAG: hypothetical protein NZ960_07145 [Candidatus Kapabacteria bacterium]|nr:hypothetical protein [Candidatus Kapabacteria bacterium]MDW8012948.1 hypothetical protein [Bacteroidota bacterium]
MRVVCRQRCIGWLGLVGGFVLLCLTGRAQLLTNNGAQVTLREGVMVVVNGDVLQQGGAASIQAYDGATLRVAGSVTVQSGNIQLQDTALMQVTQNMTIHSGATVDRGGTGSLQVQGNLTNHGTINNTGTVEVGPP